MWVCVGMGGGGGGVVNINTCFREGTGPSLKYDCWGGVEGVGGVWSGGLGVGAVVIKVTCCRKGTGPSL